MRTVIWFTTIISVGIIFLTGWVYINKPVEQKVPDLYIPSYNKDQILQNLEQYYLLDQALINKTQLNPAQPHPTINIIKPKEHHKYRYHYKRPHFDDNNSETVRLNLEQLQR